MYWVSLEIIEVICPGGLGLLTLAPERIRRRGKLFLQFQLSNGLLDM